MKGDEQLRSIIHKRSEVLAALSERPQTKPELVEAIDSSRSTIDRAIQSLENANCVDRTKSGYRLTSFGQIGFEEHRSYVETMGDLIETRPILRVLPDDVTVDTAFVRGVSVHTADPCAPESALQPSIDQLYDSEKLMCLAPVVLSIYSELLKDFIDTNDLEVEVIIRQETLDSLPEITRDPLKKATRMENLEILVTDSHLPYALWIMEQRGESIAGMIVHENGGVQGVLMNDSNEAITWARSEYNQYRASATRS